MANETVARRYAQAVFELAHEGDAVEQVGRELRTAYGAIDSDDGTRNFFYAPIIDRAEKQRILLETFGQSLGDVAMHTLLLLVRKRRERLLREIVEQYALLEQAERGAKPLLVSTARELTADQVNDLVARLSKLYGAKFDVTTEVDPELIGGMRIQMTDKRIDGTVAGRLESFARDLTQHR